jgi:serine protease Do
MPKRRIRLMIAITVLVIIFAMVLSACSIGKAAVSTTASAVATEKAASSQTAAVTTAAKVVIDPAEFGKNYKFSAGDAWMLVQPAVCYVTSVYYALVYDPNTQTYSDTYTYGPFGGTGVVLNPDNGTIVTAGHMVDDLIANEYEMKSSILDQYVYDTYPDSYPNLTEADWNWIYENYKVVGVNVDKPELEVWVQFNTAIANTPEADSSGYIRAEVKEVSDRNNRDIAILQIAPATGRALSSALLGDSSMAKIGDQLTSIGYPYTADYGASNTLEPSIFPGTISGKRTVGGAEVLQIAGYAEQGSSGGPVIDKEGKIIGIVSFGTDNMLNALRPSNDIKALLTGENKLGQVDTEWRTGLAMYNDKHYTEALKYFSAVLNLSSGHLLAQQYKALAQQNMGSDVPFNG